MILQVQLTPQAPYFLGTERNFAYKDNHTQKAQQDSYFLKSAELPNQSALFGVLRYLGIRNPGSDYRLTDEDKENIGDESFDPMVNDRKFGQINCISPLASYCEKEKKTYTYLPAPRLLSYAKSGSNEKENCYTSVQTFNNCERWLPAFYDEKKAGFGYYICLETGELIDNPFSTQVCVGINRGSDGPHHYNEDHKGFFKKQYVYLQQGYSMVFYADVQDSFWYNKEKTVVFIGQGKAPFAVTVQQVPERPDYQKLIEKLPAKITVSGTFEEPCYACLASDTFYSGSLSTLRESCMLMLGESREYRVFTTNYEATAAVGNEKHSGRYRKAEQMLRLLPAGTTFLFKNREQMEAFREKLKAADHFANGRTAGMNHVIYSK